MQDNTNPRIKLTGGISNNASGNLLSGFNESGGNVLNVQPLKIQPKPFEDKDMERVAGQMEDAIKQEQIDAIIKSKIQESFYGNVFGIKPKVVIDALVGGLKESGKTFTESTEAISKGDVSGGLAGYLHGTMQGVFSLAQVTPQLGAFTTAIDEFQKSGLVSDKVINTVMSPVTTLMQEVEKNPDLLKTVIQYAPNELKPLLASDIGRKSLSGIADVGVQAGLFHAITKGIKRVGNSSIEAQGETFSENPTQTKALTEIAGRDPIKQKYKEAYQKETSSTTGDRPFVGSQVGDTKVKLTPEEQKMMSQQKLKFEQLDIESKNLINKQMVLTEALKKNKTKANKDALRETNRKLEDVTAERNAIEDAINELGSYHEQRQLKGLIPERGSSTVYGFDISGTNKPSTGVNFVLPKEKVLEVGREGIVDKPLQGVPVKKSVHDFLTERGLDLFKLVKADKPIDSGVLGDMLSKAKDGGVYDQVLSILRQEAFKRGKVQEFETALGKANERVKVNIPEEPKGLLNEGQNVSSLRSEATELVKKDFSGKSDEVTYNKIKNLYSQIDSKTGNRFTSYDEPISSAIIKNGENGFPTDYLHQGFGKGNAGAFAWESGILEGGIKGRKISYKPNDKVMLINDSANPANGGEVAYYKLFGEKAGAILSDLENRKALGDNDLWVMDALAGAKAKAMGYDGIIYRSPEGHVTQYLKNHTVNELIDNARKLTDGKLPNNVIKDILNEGKKENPKVQVKDIKSFEEFRNASTPEITNFVKKELGDTEFNKLVKEASDRPENLTPVEDKTVTDMQSRAIEDAIYGKAQDIIFDKSQPKADPNRIISDEAYKNAGDYLKSKLGDLSVNPLFDAKAYQALLIRGAYHLENGVVRFSEWSKRMIEEHGDKIKSSLIFIWNDLQKNTELTKAGLGASLRDKVKIKDTVKDTFGVNTENIPTPKQKIVNEKLDNLTKDIQDFMNNKNVDKQTQDNVIQLIKDMEVEGGRKFTSTQMTDFRRHFLDKLTNLTQYYGKFGGELGNKSFRASSEYAKLMSDGHTILNKVNEIKDKVSPKDFRKSYGRVVDALQDRSNANNILQSDPIAQQIYPVMQDFFNYFRSAGESKGYKMVDDYYMRMAEQSLYDDFVKTKDIKSLSTDGLINFRSANSKFLKQRVMDEAHNIRTDYNGVYNYLYSISRELAYKELRDWAGKDFVEGVKNNKKLNQNLDYAQKSIDALINPERMQGKWWKRIEGAKHNMYTAFLWNNPKLAIVNYYQKQVAKTLISKEAEVLANKIYNEKYQPTGRLFDAITEAKADAPAYLGEGAIEYTINKGKLRELAEKYDMFRMSEGSNWKYSEGAGVVDYVMKTTGAKTFEQINKFLENQSVFDRAVDYARDLSARTQVSPDVAFRPLAYDHPMSRLLLMFTRYPLAMTDLMYKTLARSLEGVDGIRAQNILRRGLSEDTKPVEMLQSVEYMRKNLELSLKEVKKNRYDSPVDNKVIKSYIDFFKAKEKELNGIIKDIEPLEKTRMAGKWAKYIGISASVSFAYRLFESELWDAVGLDKDKRKKSVGQHFRDALVDATPLPLFRATSGDLTKPPIMPTIDIFLYGNFNPKGATRQTVDYISTATPYVNVMSQVYRRLTGSTIGNLTSKTIYGAEQRGQQR